MLTSQKNFKLYDLLLCIANAVDLISPHLGNHNQKVAYMAYRLAEQMGMPMKKRHAILTQGLLHDIGALSLSERLEIQEVEPPQINDHAFRSAKLMEQCKQLIPLAEAVRYHHVPWRFGEGREFQGNPVPMTSHLLHLSDRICIGFKPTDYVLDSVPAILNRMRALENKVFEPAMVQALGEISRKEYIWLDLADDNPLRFLPPAATNMGMLDLEGVLGIAQVLSHIIDFRSHFTATHSAGVSRVAQKLAELVGMSGSECKMMRIAGYLHDLGKLAVPDFILEKPGKLTAQEYSVIRGHTFYTYRLLEGIEGFSTINQWASFHHERLNGGGYPFHLNGEDLLLGSRIMAVADVFNAVAEHRPYRRGMDKQEITDVFRSMTAAGSLCSKVTGVLLNHMDLLIEVCHTTQLQAAEDYEKIFSRDGPAHSKITRYPSIKHIGTTG